VGHRRHQKISKHGTFSLQRRLGTFLIICFLVSPYLALRSTLMRYEKAPMYYRGATAALLLYDITSGRSFGEVRGWLEGPLIPLATLVQIAWLNRVPTTAHRAKKELSTGPHHLPRRCQIRFNPPTGGHVRPRPVVTLRVVPTSKITNTTASSNTFHIFVRTFVHASLHLPA